jgi:hypothetical protein
MYNATTAPEFHGFTKFLLARFCMKEVLDPLHQILGVPMEMNLRDRG